MRMYDLIEKKKRGLALTSEELKFFVDGYTAGEIPDYQAAAFCMAVCFRGMDGAECAALTEHMMNSGDTMDLSGMPDTVDKHSTGGVGDLTSLVAAPLAAAMGLTVAKMSGRGLGHTGGTIDKLESIPGFRTSLTKEEFFSQVRRVGVAVVGQTGNLAPADKKLYALRDVTDTVDSIPLIASSVMSKKLAAGARTVVLDVKYGSGAFMKTAEKARELARTMTEIGRAHGRRMAALVTSMEFPLAPQIGNSLEAEMAARILRGEDPAGWGIREVALRLAAEMLSLSRGIPAEAARREAEETLVSGRALEKFREWIAAQGGDVSAAEEGRLGRAPCVREVLSPADGYFTRADTERIGMAACLLGAGRMTKEDAPDLTAGIVMHAAPYARVERGQPLASLYAADGEKLDAGEEALLSAVGITEEPAEPVPLIAGIVR